jgi:hypothetical protein
MENVTSRRALKSAITAIRILARLEHPVKQALKKTQKRMAGTPRNQSLSEP